MIMYDVEHSVLQLQHRLKKYILSEKQERQESLVDKVDPYTYTIHPTTNVTNCESLDSDRHRPCHGLKVERY